MAVFCAIPIVFAKEVFADQHIGVAAIESQARSLDRVTADIAAKNGAGQADAFLANFTEHIPADAFATNDTVGIGDQ